MWKWMGCAQIAGRTEESGTAKKEKGHGGKVHRAPEYLSLENRHSERPATTLLAQLEESWFHPHTHLSAFGTA
jgi:hypothetical protein